MDETFWQAVHERDSHPLTPAKQAALDAGTPLPIEPYDFIWSTLSYKVAGWVISVGVIVAGRTEIPAYRVWNSLMDVEQLIPQELALLPGNR